MLNKDKDYIGLTLSDGLLQMAFLKVSTVGQKLINVTKRDVRETPEEELPKVVRSALDDLGIKRANAICAIPPNVVTTKNIEIPSLDPEEIKSIIDLQAGRHTPFSREEILVGYITIGVFQRNYTKVLLIIVNRDVIKKQLMLFESAGIKVDKVLFAPEGIATFYAKAMNIKAEDIPVGIIDIGNQATNFIIEYNKTVATCRSIPLGMAHLIKEGKSAEEKLVAELLQSLEVYQSEDINKPPETYILTSDDAKIKGLQPVFQEQLKANVKIMPYLDHVQAGQPVMLKLVSEYNDDSFLSVIALTSAMDSVQVDLTPEEIKTQRAIEEKGRQVVRSGILAIVLLILICGIFFSKIYFRSVYFSKLEEVYVTKRKAVAKLDRIAQKTRIIKDYMNSRMTALNVIDELYALIPDEIYLEDITIDETGTINIRGVSESMSRVFNFVSALEDSDFFKGVKTKSTTAKKDRGKDVAAFDLAFKLESAKDDEVVDIPAVIADEPAGKK